MIIQLFLDLIYKVFSILTSVINIPSLPDSVSSFLMDAFDYIYSGMALLDNFVMVDYCLVLLSIIVAIDVGIAIYHFVMWIIRKIPMAGMS